jgi:hypothetical protein
LLLLLLLPLDLELHVCVEYPLNLLVLLFQLFAPLEHLTLLCGDEILQLLNPLLVCILLVFYLLLLALLCLDHCFNLFVHLQHRLCQVLVFLRLFLLLSVVVHFVVLVVSARVI